MKKVFCVLFLISTSVIGQISEIIQETWYLRYLEIGFDRHFVPLGENINLTFSDNNGDMSATANGIENIFTSEADFTTTQITLSNPVVTLLGCSSPNCPYEDLYFYDVLTTINLEDKTFTYYYNDDGQGKKYFTIRDGDNNVAYYINEPIEIDPNIFQTWYLYASGVDLGDDEYYYGPDVPRITINPDFTFTGVNVDINFDGYFTYGQDELFFDDFFVLVTEKLSNPNTGIPELNFENFPLHCLVEANHFTMTSFAGFYSAFRNTITLDINDLKKNKISVYPNPVLNTLQIKSTEIPLQLEIYTLSGKRLVSNNSIDKELDVSFLTTGVYLLTITTQHGFEIQKFLKQ